VAVQQLFGLPDAAHVLVLIRRAAAERVAAPHVMVEAGALLPDVARELAAARRQAECRADRVDGRARLVSSAKRAKVERVVVRRLADHRKTRIVLRAEAHKGIALVIL